jgi:phage antirepressor YoqD-like protein
VNLIDTSTTTMTSREIAELTGKRHDNVMRACYDLRASGVTPQIEECRVINDLANGRSFMEFKLSKRDSLVLVARLSPEFTGAVVDRWLELEAAAAAPAIALPDFTNPAAAARAWADEVEAKQALQVELAAAAPAMEFVDRYVDATGLVGFRQACKVLKIKENAFREFLLEKGIAYRLGRELAPRAEHLTAGRFEVKAGVSSKNEHAFNSMRFTPKGLTWVAGEFAKHQLASQAHHH